MGVDQSPRQRKRPPYKVVVHKKAPPKGRSGVPREAVKVLRRLRHHVHLVHQRDPVAVPQLSKRSRPPFQTEQPSHRPKEKRVLDTERVVVVDAPPLNHRKQVPAVALDMPRQQDATTQEVVKAAL